MTEVGIISSSKVGFNKVGATGLLAKGCKCKIENLETGDPLGPGKKGEICVKVPYVMKGYVNNPEATAALFDKDGWVHTGDIGYYDEEGYLFVIDRIKELIKYKSYHISPTELEDILRKHPAVKEAVVVGVPHPTDGDHAVAFVVSNKPVSEHELVQYVAERVTETKQLRGGVRFVQEIPYTPTGKPKRKTLRDQLIENSSNKIW
uniref:Uncharacterized protein n=2 Tax=Rhodnius prolixus TaxID=13249 RepID=T1HAQ2_RHOPR